MLEPVEALVGSRMVVAVAFVALCLSAGTVATRWADATVRRLAREAREARQAAPARAGATVAAALAPSPLGGSTAASTAPVHGDVPDVLHDTDEPAGRDAVEEDDAEEGLPVTTLVALSVATAVVFAVLVDALGTLGLVPLAWVLAVIGGVLFVVDARTRRLPQAVVAPGAVAVVGALVVATGVDGSGAWPRALASAGIWLVVFGVPWLVTAGRGMGFGDVKLAPVVGLALGWLGWGPSLLGLISGFVVGAVVAGATLASGRIARRARVPYGPFMLLGALIGAVIGDRVWTSYLALIGAA